MEYCTVQLGHCGCSNNAPKRCKANALVVKSKKGNVERHFQTLYGKYDTEFSPKFHYD